MNEKQPTCTTTLIVHLSETTQAKCIWERIHTPLVDYFEAPNSNVTRC